MISSERLRKQLYLGSDVFIKRMETEFGVRNVGLKRGRPRNEAEK
jgi:hypothetical protein